MSESQTDDATDELHSDHIATSGAECPVSVARHTFEATEDENIHTATFTEEPWNADTETVIQLVLVDRGGVVTYHSNGVTQHQRVFTAPGAALDTFRATVAVEAETWNEYGDDEWHIEFSPGFGPVTFDDVNVDGADVEVVDDE